MRYVPALALCMTLGVGGCTLPPQPPSPQPIAQAVDRIENDLFIAERIWATAERALYEGQIVSITLRVTAKKRLEYVYWREAFGSSVINSYQDTEFMMLQVPSGHFVEWKYFLEGVRAGQDAIDGLIRAAIGLLGQEARLRAVVTVYEGHR